MSACKMLNKDKDAQECDARKTQ